MTPAINLVRKANIRYTVHEYQHDPATGSYGLEAAQKLDVEETRVFKTLLVDFGEKALAVAILPVSAMLSMKLIAKALGAKKAVMADAANVERSSGYVLGGVSPLGQKKRLKTFIDVSAEQFTTIYVSAGRRGLDIELSPKDLKQLTNAVFVPLCQ